jgi:hypothetical protein
MKQQWWEKVSGPAKMDPGGGVATPGVTARQAAVEGWRAPLNAKGDASSHPAAAAQRQTQKATSTGQGGKAATKNMDTASKQINRQYEGANATRRRAQVAGGDSHHAGYWAAPSHAKGSSMRDLVMGSVDDCLRTTRLLHQNELPPELIFSGHAKIQKTSSFGSDALRQFRRGTQQVLERSKLIEPGMSLATKLALLGGGGVTLAGLAGLGGAGIGLGLGTPFGMGAGERLQSEAERFAPELVDALAMEDQTNEDIMSGVDPGGRDDAFGGEDFSGRIDWRPGRMAGDSPYSRRSPYMDSNGSQVRLGLDAMGY